MAREFRLPDIGEGLTEAEVVRWLVGVGEPVAMDQPVVEVETDKAVVEIPCPFAGVVLHHGAAEGEVVEVGEILIVVGEEGESWGESPSEPAPIVGSISENAEDVSRVEPRTLERQGPRALPVVRKLAKELGVDIDTIEGTGPQGRVTREDVMAASSEPAPIPSAERESAASPNRRPLSKLRRTIAANMVRSWTEIPHVTTFDEVDATRLLAVRKALQRRHDVAIPIDALVIAAVVPALEHYPEFASKLDGDDLVTAERYDIGVAVDTDDGLMVAVVADAASRSIVDLSRELGRLAEGAKSRKLSPKELTGQCFTVSNIGAVGGGYGTPIIPPDTTAILSVGRAVERPVARHGGIEIAPIMPLSLSYDHRLIDGALGRRFVAMVIENLEEPGLFLS